MNSKRTEVGPTPGLILLISFDLSEMTGGAVVLQQPHSLGGAGNDGINMCRRFRRVRVLGSSSSHSIMVGLRGSRGVPKPERGPLISPCIRLSIYWRFVLRVNPCSLRRTTSMICHHAIVDMSCVANGRLVSSGSSANFCMCRMQGKKFG